jgi:hypothetical protein
MAVPSPEIMIAYYNQLHIKINFLRSAIGFLKVACAAGEGLCDINATEFVRPLRTHAPPCRTQFVSMNQPFH